MAGDIRDSSKAPDRSSEALIYSPRSPPPDPNSPPTQVQSSSKVYEVFDSRPENANALPDGYGQNTAGAKAPVPTISEAIKTVRLSDLKQVYMYPCARESLLTGIGGGFAVGGVRALLNAPLLKSCNWAVGTFCFLGIGAYEFCLQKRRLEKANMKRAMEIVDRKKAEKERQAQIKRDERRRAKEAADQRKEDEERRRGWGGWGGWKFW